MGMKTFRATVIAIALGVSGTGMLTSTAQAALPSPEGASTRAGWNGGFLYQGNDIAHFSFRRHKVNVCDKEKDGHAVYAYLRHRNDLDATVIYDNTSGCTSNYIESKSAYKYVTICESVWGPDWCHTPVHLR